MDIITISMETIKDRPGRMNKGGNSQTASFSGRIIWIADTCVALAFYMISYVPQILGEVRILDTSEEFGSEYPPFLLTLESGQGYRQLASYGLLGHRHHDLGVTWDSEVPSSPLQ